MVAQMTDEQELYAFVCVWCGAHSDSSTSRFAPCTAPDGDGHLFKRTKLKNSDSTPD